MNYAEARPSQKLASYIKCFWMLQYDGGSIDAPTESILPDGCPEIVFNLSDPFLRLHTGRDELQSRSIFVGQISRSISIKPTGSVWLFGVRLHPFGSSALVDFPISDLTDEIIDLRIACPPAGAEIESRIDEARTFAEQVIAFESFLAERLARRERFDHLSSFACNRIIAGSGVYPIARIADETGVSERRLERRFKRTVGVSPKLFSRIVRFQAVVNSIQVSSPANLLDTALSFGYYDQSHLIRDFNEFSGVTPLAFLERTHQISDVFTRAG